MKACFKFTLEGLAAMVLSVSTAHAQITTLMSFNGTEGASPYAGLILSGGTFYGTTDQGGASSGKGGANNEGTVFSVDLNTDGVTTLARFSGTDGAGPYAGLILSGSTFYGTTVSGGANGYGTVFSVSVTGGSPTTLASFNYTNGTNPYAGLTLSGSTLYGTTYGGGANGDGTVFSFDLNTDVVTTLASFNGTNGQSSVASLTLSGNTLYGTTNGGGTNGDGTVFSLDLSTNVVTTLASFDGTNGRNPHASLTLSGSTLYGTAITGGTNGDGTVFSLDLNTDTVTTLASFDGTNGQNPSASLTLSGNTLYGTTNGGGNNGDGTVFSLDLNTDAVTTLASFNGTDGAYPTSSLTLSGGILYGTTRQGGANGDGTVFSIALVPEPSTWAMVLGGLGLLIFGPTRRRLGRIHMKGPLRIAFGSMSLAFLSISAAQAQILVDGTLDSTYGSPLATQTINAGFGDSTVGNGSSTGGSELDAVYGQIQNGNLYLFVSGNLEQNYNHINIFIADGRSGQNTLNVPGVLGAMNGSTFSPGFSATYALDLNGGIGANGALYVDQYNLIGTPNTTYLGGVALSGGVGSATLSGVQIGFNNTNAAGVIASTSGTAANQTAADAVTTGLELAIPLSQLGSPTGSIKVLIDLNGNADQYLSNQFLPGLTVGTGNLYSQSGGVFNFGATANEFLRVSAVPEPSTLALLLGAMSLLIFGSAIKFRDCHVFSRSNKSLSNSRLMRFKRTTCPIVDSSAALITRLFN